MEGVDSEVQVTINRPKRIIHFSDGVEEEIEEEKVNELQSAPETEQSVDPKNLSWGPWLSHYALKSGSSVLYAVDYAGESLATFFGITTPKYQIEIDEYERIQEEKRKLEEESAGWVPRNVEGEIPLVMSEPLKKEPEQV
ncbi:protein FAM177A1-like isoform X1 [Maniola jurtina]|uniref:protein FAM177A1-like isoform X1 n=1 Tax=Maniola jurtina TaxID=191418 RepID=UPI001E686B10|nr:protein FAM177A1-like isoform X1 [Maniola jurtina]